jgi:hypothetical protein
MGFILENESPKTFKIAKELARHQWDVIVYLLDQRDETFKIHKELKDDYLKLSALIQNQMINEHEPDKLPN